MTTHVSHIVFTDARAYKLKRPVRLPFVDLSVAPLRDAVLREELRLNRRLAPDVYLGVEPVDDAEPYEPVLVMRRLPDDRRLAAVVATGGGRECCTAVARTLAAFHAEARRGPEIDARATRDAVLELWRAGFAQWSPFVGDVLERGVVDEVERRAEAFLQGREPLFAARIADHRVVDGHGDLLTDDIFCLDDGPRLLDCLEFDPGLRAGDVLADAAFCAMDLERLGRPDLAARFLAEVQALELDDAPSSLAHHYVAYRAHVRAKIACIRTRSGDPGARHEAAQLLAIARSHLRSAQIRLVLVGGLPATGKTTLGALLAEQLDAEHLRSDVVRKTRAGVVPTDSARAPFGGGIYSPARTADAYAALVDIAREHLEHGRSVVIDASFADARHRNLGRALARDTASELSELQCDAPREIVTARLAARAARRDDASDADAAVRDAMAQVFDEWPEATRVDTTNGAGAALPGLAEWLGFDVRPHSMQS